MFGKMVESWAKFSNKSSFHRGGVLLVAGMAFAIVPSVHGSPVATLFTTQEDFAQFATLNSDTIAASGAYDADGSTTNGLGNNTAAGSTGTAGSLAFDSNNANIPYGETAYVDESNNQAFMTALDPGSTIDSYPPPNYNQVVGTTTNYSGTLYLSYTYPAYASGYFGEVGVNFNYQGHGYNPQFSSSTAYSTVDGMTTATATIPYTISATQTSYFNFQLFDNANASSVTSGYYVDDIQVAVPEPASLSMLGLAGWSLLGRGRRK